MDFKQILLRKNIASIQVLIDLVDSVRPGRLESTEFATKRLRELHDLLRSDEEVRNSLKHHVVAVFHQTTATNLYTQSGIYSSSGFFSDLFQKFRHILLPPLKDPEQLQVAIQLIFHKPWDFKWVEAIPDSFWLMLLKETDISLQLRPSSEELEEFLNSILILSHRISVMGLEPVLTSRIPGIDSLESPFFQLNIEVSKYVELLKNQILEPVAEQNEYRALNAILDQCEEKLHYVKLHKDKIGASMSLTYLSGRLQQHMKRMRILLYILHDTKGVTAGPVVRLFKEFVYHENTSHNLFRHVSANIGLLAYQVTEHAARTGEHYISTDRKEYWDFFKRSLGGGALVGVLVLIKIIISKMHLAAFNETLLNSLNYGIGFIIIHLSGFTLATKQPAMTASKLAEALEGHTNDSIGVTNLAQLIVRISRTQFVSFAGNLLMAFPVAWLLSFGYTWFFGHHPADPAKAANLLNQVHPWYSLSVWYASIAGVLLFSSGLISGYFDNKTVYNNIPERLFNHPLLKVINPSKRRKFTNYMDHNLGGLAGNFILGFLLASMAFIGFIMGLPLDVRHVTFVTGSFGLATESLDNMLSIETIFTVIAGIVLIGLFNFLVSFGLAIFTAIRARQVKFSETRKLLHLLAAYLFTYPFDFIFPPSKERKIELVESDKTISEK
jgi:site-specific recombinase